VNLEILWYFVIIASLIFYAVLDGFDLGVGCIHLFAKNDQDRRIFLNSIGPVWDGNEVWLVIVGGALFAGFPDVYATLFSSFYNLVMLLLSGLIFRATAIEFRSKVSSQRWRSTWDVVFFIASLIIAFGIGVVLGNLVAGIPLDAEKNFIGTTLGFLHPYALLVGVTTVALFMMHGSIYLVMKTEGALHSRLRLWVNKMIIFFIVSYALTTFATLSYQPHMTAQMKAVPHLFIIPLIALLAILNVPYQLRYKRDGWAFISSCISIALLLSLFAIGTFPIMIRSSINPATYSLTIVNTASSPLTLKVLLTIVAIGIPFVLAYGYYVYRIFRGKVRLEKGSY
jgi:cytochrome d ubiquinol oxidase subunit II